MIQSKSYLMRISVQNGSELFSYIYKYRFEKWNQFIVDCYLAFLELYEQVYEINSLNGIDFERNRTSKKSFRFKKGRLELVGYFRDVLFYIL